MLAATVVIAPLVPEIHHPVPLVLSAEFRHVAAVYAIPRLLGAALMAASLVPHVHHPVPPVLSAELRHVATYQIGRTLAAAWMPTEYS